MVIYCKVLMVSAYVYILKRRSTLKVYNDGAIEKVSFRSLREKIYKCIMYLQQVSSSIFCVLDESF